MSSKRFPPVLSATCMALALALGSTAALAHPGHDYAAEQPAQHRGALHSYAAVAEMSYAASLTDAEKLQAAIRAFAAHPSDSTLAAAKQAWLQSRETYGRTEVFRLSGGPIDAEEGWVADAYGNLESQINAWPLDEHMIDYTIDEHGKRTRGNIIDSRGRFKPGGEDAKAVNIDQLTPEVLTALNENGGEANVASGYHAIEFLLWGQDQDYENFVDDKVSKGATTAGQRPLSDFTADRHAQRRLAYLQAAADKLVADLQTVHGAWKADGIYRQALAGTLRGADAGKNLQPEAATKAILAGMGMFIKSELANERIAVAVLTPSEEDEHSCFSDNTHRDILQNFEGFKDVFYGRYLGKKIGAGFADALKAEEQQRIGELIARIDQRIARIDQLARTSMHFDYQIHPNNHAEVQNIVSLKNDLRRLGDEMVTVAAAHGISLTTEDVTDAEETKI